MRQWLSEVWCNLLGRSSGRKRYMLCAVGHISLSRLPDNSQCDAEGENCDAIMRPLTEPLWSIFPLSERVIQLQTLVYMARMGQKQHAEAYRQFLKMHDEMNELVLFFRSYYPEDLNGAPGRSIVELALTRLKQGLPVGSRV